LTSNRSLGELLGRVDLPDADLYLIGWGHRLPNDLTLETLAVLRRVEKVFALPSFPDLGFTVDAIDFDFLYEPGRPRTEVYRQIADTVLDAAVAEPPVAFATFGSATVGTSSVHTMLADAPGRGLRTHVSPGVSCLEAIWAEVPLEPFSGVFIRDATAFLATEQEPPTTVDLILVQAPVLNLQETPGTPQSLKSIDLTPLRDHLLRFYDADHLIGFVRVASHGLPTDVATLHLRDLGPSPGDMSTLLVPRRAGGPTGSLGAGRVLRGPSRRSTGISRLDLSKLSAAVDEYRGKK
jgi:hypothetical protein